MTDYSRWRAWHVWTDSTGTHEFSCFMGGWPGFALASRRAANVARQDREANGGFGVTRNFVQFLPPGVRPTKF